MTVMFILGGSEGEVHVDAVPRIGDRVKICDWPEAVVAFVRWVYDPKRNTRWAQAHVHLEPYRVPRETSDTGPYRGEEARRAQGGGDRG